MFLCFILICGYSRIGIPGVALAGFAMFIRPNSKMETPYHVYLYDDSNPGVCGEKTDLELKEGLVEDSKILLKKLEDEQKRKS